MTRNVLIITGAGASTHLGRDERPIPLMGEWADRMRYDINSEVTYLADAAGLRPGMSGEEFEQALGDALHWLGELKAFPRFARLGNDALQRDALDDGMGRWHERAQGRGQVLLKAINDSLWNEFGLGRIDTGAARVQYKKLLRGSLGFDPSTPEGIKVAFATTNYDRSLEPALQGTSIRFNTGAKDTPGMTPVVDPDSIFGDGGAWNPNSTEVPVLYLHGAVGWYRNGEGDVEVDFGDRSFDERRAPALLYPDPNKDPTAVDALAGIWSKFAQLLAGASDVLVLGHSLHDRPILEELVRTDGFTPGRRLAIGIRSDLSKSREERLRDHKVGENQLLGRLRPQLGLLKNTSLEVVPLQLGNGDSLWLEPLEKWWRNEPISR